MKESFTEKPSSTVESHLEYMGVKLPVAQNRETAPQVENFSDYVEDAFSRDMERIVATGWALREPILIEGGTSLGKTRTVKKMCAELGYEIHYQNLNNHTDPADLMGKYIPNPAQISENEPRYTFADGSVTKALRFEQGKIKVLILDEYNAAHPGVIIRLHEVLDAYKTGSTVTLSEDGNEILKIERDGVRIIAITNPAGGGFADREPLDPAQMRRWTYHKLPDELPIETFKAGVLALSGLGGVKTELDISREKHTLSKIDAIPTEVLGELHGMKEIVPQYVAFHEATKNMLKEKRIANNQRQKFSFDDREEPRRVFSYIARFYNGDMGTVMRDALRYFYAGKVLDPNDKAKLEEMIRKVDYTPARNPERHTLSEGVIGKETESILSERVIRTAFGAKMREALKIRVDVIGPRDFANYHGDLLDIKTDLDKSLVTATLKKVLLDPIPYSSDELTDMKTNNVTVVLCTRLAAKEFREKLLSDTLQTSDFYWSAAY